MSKTRVYPTGSYNVYIIINTYTYSLRRSINITPAPTTSLRPRLGNFFTKTQNLDRGGVGAINPRRGLLAPRSYWPAATGIQTTSRSRLLYNLRAGKVSSRRRRVRANRVFFSFFFTPLLFFLALPAAFGCAAAPAPGKPPCKTFSETTGFRVVNAPPAKVEKKNDR